MNKRWIHKVFLAVFLFTMVTPVPVQAMASAPEAASPSFLQSSAGLSQPAAESAPLAASLNLPAGADQAPVAVGTPVPVMSRGENLQKDSAPVQLDAPVAALSGVAAPSLVGVGYQDDSSSAITWTGTWTTLSSGNALGGTYRSSTTTGSTASLEFTGTRVSLIYAKAPNRGSVEIRIDGSLVTTLSMAATTEQWQQRWDSPIQANTGPHTITLTHSVTGQVVVDAFEVTNPDPAAPLSQGYYEDTDGHFQYSGNWTAWTGSGPSGGGNHYSATVGDTVSVTFSGTQLTLYYTGYVNRGVADILIDGTKVASLNQYDASLVFQKRWQSEILANNGPHTLTIRHASGAYIDIDALNIEDIQLPDPVGPGTYENNDPNLVYIGNWTTYNSASASGGSGKYSSTIGSYALLRFTGKQVNLLYTANVNNGNAEIRIDGQLVNTLNQYAASQTYQKQWASPLLADEGPHTVTITHASGGIIDIDALVVSNPSAPGAGTYEDTSSLISYAGKWNPYSSTSASGGSSRYSDQLGSTADFTFVGNQVSIIYTGYGNRGTLDVRVDGQLIGTINQKTSTLAWKQRWDSSVLSGTGPHTLRLTHASGTIADIDAIIITEVGPTPTPTASPNTLTEGTYDDTDSKIGYTGNWTLYSSTTAYNGGSRYSQTIGDTVTFEFFGTQLSLLYTGYSNRGDMTIKVDNVVVATLNQYSKAVTWQNRWDSAVLASAGPHSVTLTHATGLIMDLDAVIITGGATEPTPTDTVTPTSTFTFTPTATPAFDPPDGKEVYRSSYAPAASGDRPPSTSGNYDSYGDSISGNGQYVVFSSLASNLIYSNNVCGSNGFTDVYLHDRQTGTNQCLSTMLGAAVNDDSTDPFISDTGQFVVFASQATNFTSGGAPANISQIYLRNRSTGDTILVSVPEGGGYADGDCYDPYVTPDGQYVVFSSAATNLVSGDTNGSVDVFVRDMGDRGPGGTYSGSGQQTLLISRTSAGAIVNASAQGSRGSFISDNGQYAAFTSSSPDLTGDSSGNTKQVFLRDLTANTTTMVSTAADDSPGNGNSWLYNLTPEGRFVMFYSTASNLVSGGNTTEDAYVYDRQLDTITMLSVPAAQAIDPFPPVEGGRIAFETTKALLSEDTNGRKDVYVRSSSGTLLASLPVGASATGSYASYGPVISRDGRFVAFDSSVNALDPVTNPPTGGEPVLDNVYIRQIGGHWSGPTAGFYDDVDPNITYSSGWLTEAGSGAYGGSFHYSNTIGKTASFSFKGRQISLIYAGFTNRGTMEIKIDGQVVDTLNQYTASMVWQKRWNSPVLDNEGPHTMVLTHKTGSVVTVDALEVQDITVVGPGVYDDAGGDIRFQGTWADWPTTGPYAGTLKYSNDNTATASMSFYGTQVSLIYTKYTTRGNISIQIDNNEPVLLNQYGSVLQWQQRWDSPDLEEGIHTITMRHPGGTTYIDVDALIVTYPSYEMDPPSPITDLNAATGENAGTVNLTWTATGDDFANGTASQYIVRYSSVPITTEEIWAGAADVDGEPVPQVSGSDEAWTATGLTPGQFYYFAIRAKDDGANLSGLSNSPGATSQVASANGAGTYDDNHAAFTYAGTWTAYSSSGPYNNTLHLSNVGNSTATFTFTGTQISLIYTKYSTRGNLEIKIDGNDPVTLNQYSKTLMWQQRWDSPLLTAGTHTITFRHPGGTKYVDIDAVIVTNPETTPPATVSDLSAATGPDKGSVDLTWTAPGDDGTEGTATEYILRYATTAITNETAWTAAKDVIGEPTPSVAGTTEHLRITGLDPTKLYYFALRAKDDANNTSAISNSADAYSKMPDAVGTGTYDDPHASILFIGTWETYNKTGPYNATLQLTNVADNKAIIRFTGTQVSLIYSKYTSRGNIEITIDGGTPVLLNQYGSSLQWQQRWDSPLLSEGTHTMILRHPGGSYYVDVDAIVVSQPESIPPAAITGLNATSGASLGSVNLNWTAPGDDDNTGTASSYIVRYASSPIDSQGAWDAAKDVTGEPTPVAAGGAQNMTITGLVPGQTYYFAIRTLDDVPNLSGLSNSPSAAAKAPDAVGGGTYDDASGAIAFVGTWQTQTGSGPYNSTMRFTNEVNAAAYFTFTGTQFSLIFTRYTTRGNIEIVIDGGAPILLNQYGSTLQWQQRWDSATLSSGTHNIILRHPASGTHYVDVDAIIVAP
jgi:hypothetical protein